MTPTKRNGLTPGTTSCPHPSLLGEESTIIAALALSKGVVEVPGLRTALTRRASTPCLASLQAMWATCMDVF